jgi:dTMP kinase
LKNRLKGRLIVFEGGEGSGKSTQLEKIYAHMKRLNNKTVLLREPGGTAISEMIREVILNPANTAMSEKTELLLYIACRAQLVEEKLIPLLKSGYTVLLDRFYLATVVYQGYARGIDRQWPAEAAKRMKKRAKSDRLDREAAGFHKKVRNGYLTEAGRSKNCAVVSTDKKSPGQVYAETLSILENRGVL